MNQHSSTPIETLDTILTGGRHRIRSISNIPNSMCNSGCSVPLNVFVFRKNISRKFVFVECTLGSPAYPNFYWICQNFLSPFSRIVLWPGSPVTRLGHKFLKLFEDSCVETAHYSWKTDQSLALILLEIPFSCFLFQNGHDQVKLNCFGASICQGVLRKFSPVFHVYDSEIYNLEIYFLFLYILIFSTI